MEPILKSHFVKFKTAYEIETNNNSVKEGAAFEKFVNYTILSLDGPEAFTADSELLDSVTVGGGDDIFLDGIGIWVNHRLVRSIEEVKEIAESSKRVTVEFTFIQSKMQPGFEITQLNDFGTGVRLFFSEPSLPENSKIKNARAIKDFIYSDEYVISKLQRNPSVRLIFVATGTIPENDHFTAIRRLIVEQLEKQTDCYFESVALNLVGGRELTKYCLELANSFEVQLNIKDILPLSVDAKAEVKKAYAFTCAASEFLRILQKEDGSLRKSLFSDNVRDYLGNQGSINQEIGETVRENPEMFLLCNNGVTIVCSGFEQVRDKLVKVENPQIVNGCQTSNTIFEFRSHENISKLQLLIRVICTDNTDVSNKVVRGTNRQNQVLEEAFEATNSFHKDVLEPYFLAYEGSTKVLYERRARQYFNDPQVKKTQIVNLRILIQTFVGMFFEAPHDAHRHEAKLLEKYAEGPNGRRIFRDDHSAEPYLVAALTWYMFDRFLREEEMDSHYRTYKAHLYLAFRYAITPEPIRLQKSRALEAQAKQFLAALDENSFIKHAKAATSVFDKTYKEWLGKGGSKFGIKDNKEFTDLLITNLQDKTAAKRDAPIADEERQQVREGTILRVLWRNGVWFGFIQQGFGLENVYFDSRAYRGEPRELLPNRKVKFGAASGERGIYARNLTFLD